MNMRFQNGTRDSFHFGPQKSARHWKLPWKLPILCYRKRFPGTQFYGDEMLKRKEAWHQQALAKAKNGKSR